MAKWIIEDTTLAGIADAIREKSGSTDTIMVAELASAIADLPSGGGFPKVACGSFLPTVASGEEYYFEHELGVVPDFIIITQKSKLTATNQLSLALYKKGYSSTFAAVAASSSSRYSNVANIIHDIDSESFSFLSEDATQTLTTTQTYYWYAVAEE